MIIHGGYWKNEYNIDNSLIDTLPDFLINQNYAVYVLEYRRVEGSNGGWPETNQDILIAMIKLNEYKNIIDINKVVVSGHSAGFH